MKATIENYRGFDIWYDTDIEVFQCIITDGKEKESKSFKAVKKFVDDYRKENNDFVTFNVVKHPDRDYTDSGVFKVVGQDKLGRFVLDNNGKKETVSKYSANDFILEKKCNEPIIKAYSKNELLAELSRKEFAEKRKRILAKLDVVTLKEMQKKNI